MFTVKSPASRSLRMSLQTEGRGIQVSRKRRKSRAGQGRAGPHISMAQHTRMRKSKRSLSENSVSQMRMTSGRRNSWDSSRVSQRKVKY